LIDIESKVFDTIFNAVTAVYPNADVTTGYDEKTAVFPCVVVEEMNNAPYRQTVTDDCSENHSRITYDVNVYTDNTNTAKSVGKDILKIVDNALQGLKFRRLNRSKPLNINRTVFRQYGRWEVIVSKPIEIGDDTVYQMYRR
jgi:hypothetical protein